MDCWPVVGPVEAAATAAAAAATKEEDEIVLEEGRNEPDDEELPNPLDRPDDKVESLECLLLREDDEDIEGCEDIVSLEVWPLMVPLNW